jgi:hypothetical protein
MTFPNPSYSNTLQESMRSENSSLMKRGVYDDSSVDVYVNATGGFAQFAPPPTVDYWNCKLRHQSLGLTEYKKAWRAIKSRYSKTKSCFNGASSVLEIGIAEHAFLAFLRAMRLGLALTAPEAHGLAIAKAVI